VSAATTAAPARIEVSDLVDGQKIGPFLIGIIVLGFLAQIGDGYDLAATAYAAPSIVKAWHLKRELFAPVLSAGLVGMLVGAPIFGYVGDRAGRRVCIIICTAIGGIFTMLAAGAGSLTELVILRFLTGIGLGGLPANTIALMAEYAPSRSRATLITLMFMGITFGGMVPALVTWIAPQAHWSLLFIVGGAMPLVASLLNLLFMPESLKFLAAKDRSRAKLLPLARRMRPDLALADGTEFVFPHKQEHRFRLSMLFEGRLRWTTPLIWVLFVTNLMVNFFLNSWMPTVLREAGLSPSDAAVTASMYYVGGVIGGLTIARALDRTGLGLIALFLVLACPAVLCLGIPGLSSGMLKVVVLLVGVTVLGNQLSFNSVAGLNYPTAIRANGTGWALGIGRLGAIAGPIIGGKLLAMHLPPQQLFIAPTIPLAIGAVAAFILRPMVRDRFGRQAIPPMGGAGVPLAKGPAEV
jgi:MFS transporter, AAHS family, 4-hydroxybenzoate transporter